MDVIEKVRSTIGAYAEDDIRFHLQSDHRIIKELVKEIEEATTATARKSAFAKLKVVLTAHARAEEKAVYVPLTKLRQSHDSRMAGNEGNVEHGLADTLVAQLAKSGDASTDLWQARAKVLKEMLEHHIQEEERDVFEEVGEHFSDEDRMRMANTFLKRKNELLKPPRRASAKKTGRTAAKGGTRKAAKTSGRTTARKPAKTSTKKAARNTVRKTGAKATGGAAEKSLSRRLSGAATGRSTRRTSAAQGARA